MTDLMQISEQIKPTKKAQITVFFSVLLTSFLLFGCTSTSVPSKNTVIDYTTQFTIAKEQLQVRTPQARTEKKPLVMVHYMPWFQSPPVEEGYGFHWHLGGGVFDPFETHSDGRAKIASHTYPLTGPYDSRDSSILEYQVALMKLSGIDGVIFDWYGIEDALDYKMIHESTKAMIEILEKAEMKFAICYEDQSIGKMIEAKNIQKEESLAAGKKVFAWMDKNWFNRDSYLKFDGRPVLLCFGPQFYKDAKQWDLLFEETKEKPWFVSLDNHSEGWADGSYNWPPMWASSAGKLGIPRLVTYLNDFYNKQYSKKYLVASAFPAFHDIYQEAGSGKSYGFLDYSEGETFKLTLDAALMAFPDVIQIGTWNDYGEGTSIEPTIERGYRELEYLQDVQKKYNNDFPWGYEDLRIPIELHKVLRSTESTNSQKDAARLVYSEIMKNNITNIEAFLNSAGVKKTFAVKPLLRKSGEALQTLETTSFSVFDSSGKTNIALGMPLIASSRIYEFTGNKAVDGDILTYWEGGANTYPNTISVDLVSAQIIKTVVIKLNPKRIWNKRIQNIEVQVSDDSEKFKTIIPASDYLFDPVTNENSVDIPLNVKARHIRLVIYSNNGAKGGQIAEVEVYSE
ncbi:MAG TPA: discoidin domain-containing protein [Treponemataceae bacterium]|nr:discoidin domain-containing protein [Treponemataceae bacterium]